MTTSTRDTSALTPGQRVECPVCHGGCGGYCMDYYGREAYERCDGCDGHGYRCIDCCHGLGEDESCEWCARAEAAIQAALAKQRQADRDEQRKELERVMSYFAEPT